MFHPNVFFDIGTDSKYLVYISFKLCADKIPKTAEIFHVLGIGEKMIGVFGYKVSPFTELFQDLCAKVVTSYAMMALWASSILGKKIEDENLILKYSGSASLSMANAELNTNDAQCFHLHHKTE